MIGRYAVRLSFAMILMGLIGIYEHFFEVPPKAPGLGAPLILFAVGIVAWRILRIKN